VTGITLDLIPERSFLVVLVLDLPTTGPAARCHVDGKCPLTDLKLLLLPVARLLPASLAGAQSCSLAVLQFCSFAAAGREFGVYCTGQLQYGVRKCDVVTRPLLPIQCTLGRMNGCSTRAGGSNKNKEVEVNRYTVQGTKRLEGE
jgi:hypothetical protein